MAAGAQHEARAALLPRWPRKPAREREEPIFHALFARQPAWFLWHVRCLSFNGISSEAKFPIPAQLYFTLEVLVKRYGADLVLLLPIMLLTAVDHSEGFTCAEAFASQGFPQVTNPAQFCSQQGNAGVGFVTMSTSASVECVSSCPCRDVVQVGFTQDEPIPDTMARIKTTVEQNVGFAFRVTNLIHGQGGVNLTTDYGIDRLRNSLQGKDPELIVFHGHGVTTEPFRGHRMGNRSDPQFPTALVLQGFRAAWGPSVALFLNSCHGGGALNDLTSDIENVGTSALSWQCAGDGFTESLVGLFVNPTASNAIDTDHDGILSANELSFAPSNQLQGNPPTANGMLSEEDVSPFLWPNRLIISPGNLNLVRSEIQDAPGYVFAETSLPSGDVRLLYDARLVQPLTDGPFVPSLINFNPRFHNYRQRVYNQPLILACDVAGGPN